MASQPYQPHFVLIPFMTQGHLMPMIDIAKLLAERNVFVTIATTPTNASRLGATINRAIQSGLPIRVFEIPFPGTQFGLPEGCETIDDLPSPTLSSNFLAATAMMQQPLEQLLLTDSKPSPSCILSDKNLPWASTIASKFKIPLILFDGWGCFSLLCFRNLEVSKVYENVSESEPIVVPGLADRFEFTISQLPVFYNPGAQLDLKDVRDKIMALEEQAYGILINSFEELEKDYVQQYQRTTGRRAWCIGPVSLCNKDKQDKAERGNKASSSTDHENQCLKWLDSRAPGSVIYVCLGSLSRLTPPQLIELGLGLEATNRPFIWVMRGDHRRSEMDKWLAEDRYQERVKGRGLLIRDWAPQVLILSHPAIGGFLTHCGWNSTLEGISAGVPLVTWPLFAEQFFNEKLVEQVLKIGVRVGVEVAVYQGQEEKFGVLVSKEHVRKAVEKIMGQGKEEEERRQSAKRLGHMANKAIEVGGSSFHNITSLIEDIVIMQGAKEKEKENQSK